MQDQLEMDLSFKADLSTGYTSAPQRIRVLTEHWMGARVFCPNCGNSTMSKHRNNKPVADFFCSGCGEDYELKSKSGTIGDRIVDGAYKTMIERLKGGKSPNLFLLSYDSVRLAVSDLLVVPKHLFVSSMIEMRKPLSPTARRAGWVGCNIVLKNLPQMGKIFFVKDSVSKSKDEICSDWRSTLFLREVPGLSAKGWLLDIIRCIERLGRNEFGLDELYSFDAELERKYPGNRNVRPKIRQQLQLLREKGYLEFLGGGRYRRCLAES